MNLKKYILSRPIPDRLITALRVVPVLKETDPVFGLQSGVNLIPLLKRRTNLELTQREKHILWLRSHGFSEKEIAPILRIKVHTVRLEIRKARMVLRARNTNQAIGLALRGGLID
jgi:DNA-binding CsgD family transcriptional regulator